MKKHLLNGGLILAVLAILCTQPAAAQIGQDLKNKTPEQRATFQTSIMKSKLSLDSGQVVKVQAINLKYAQKFEPILNSTDSKFARYRQAKTLMTAKDGELKTVFTSNQYKQYEDMKAEMQEKMKDKMAANN